VEAVLEVKKTANGEYFMYAFCETGSSMLKNRKLFLLPWHF